MRRLITVMILAVGLLAPSVAWAKEPAMPEMTLQQAVDKALANSKALKTAEYDIERSEEVRDNASDKVKWTPAGPISGEGAAQAARAFTGLVQADLAWQMSKKSYNAEKDSVVMSVYQAYDRILQAQEGVRSAELALKAAEWQHRAAYAGLRAGTISKSDFLKGDASLEGAKASLEAAKKALEDAYQQFNQLVGLWPEDRPVLVDKPVFTPLKIDDLDYEVERAVEESPTLWLAKKQIDLAKLNLDLYVFNDPTNPDPYKAKEIDVNKAEVSAASADEKMRQLVRTIYYSIRQLEDQYAGLEQQVKVAQENLRVIRLKYDLGMATRTEVVAAEAALAGAQKALLDATCQHEVLKMAFEKPWAYAASAVSAGGSRSSSSGGQAGSAASGGGS
ncbi:TolC family protein [Desulfofundulus thermobenzoicus]|uniref:TolC family protein n=1 Tax=Desulfofundulus thermobenzoicus TaxID=29376 RepID=A0A6N7INH0_9FIRM|nr:TolC family protein [Desulfofundulus thermobenzoicus]MQL51546.1 TolC family protein [Desulfofundulus thermobenzoicus]